MHLGRTDAGVHALAQMANFKTNSNFEVEKYPIALNSKLKKSIRIQKAEEVEERFHCRYSCKQKTYRYIINNSKQGSAIYRNLEYFVPNKLNIEAMQKAIKEFEGEHDFKAFKASGTSSKSSVRIIYKAEAKQEGDRIILELTGNGFLYNMVRIIAGAIVEVRIRKNKTRRNTRYHPSRGQNKSRKNIATICIIFSKSRIRIKKLKKGTEQKNSSFI